MRVDKDMFVAIFFYLMSFKMVFKTDQNEEKVLTGSRLAGTRVTPELSVEGIGTYASLTVGDLQLNGYVIGMTSSLALLDNSTASVLLPWTASDLMLFSASSTDPLGAYGLFTCARSMTALTLSSRPSITGESLGVLTDGSLYHQTLKTEGTGSDILYILRSINA